MGAGARWLLAGFLLGAVLGVPAHAGAGVTGFVAGRFLREWRGF